MGQKMSADDYESSGKYNNYRLLQNISCVALAYSGRFKVFAKGFDDIFFHGDTEPCGLNLDLSMKV